MLAIACTSRIFLCREPVDMRKSYDGLACIVENHFGENPLNGEFFVFVNKRMDRLKVLFWDTGGFCLFCKRLEKGNFRLPVHDSEQIDRASLQMILEGIDLKNVNRLPRYIP